jgi:hypothetical protein
MKYGKFCSLSSRIISIKFIDDNMLMDIRCES